jgi:hypothetical protein
MLILTARTERRNVMACIRIQEVPSSNLSPGTEVIGCFPCRQMGQYYKLSHDGYLQNPFQFSIKKSFTIRRYRDCGTHSVINPLKPSD